MSLAREELPMLLEPALELLSLPALGKVVAEERECGLEFRSSKEPGEVVPALVAIWAVHASPKTFR
jgi:hypothetical protein